MLSFLILLPSRKNSLFEFVSEHRLNCPRELLAKAKGENLFKDENSVVRGHCGWEQRKLGSSSALVGLELLAVCAGCIPWKDRLGKSRVPQTWMRLWGAWGLSVFF